MSEAEINTQEEHPFRVSIGTNSKGGAQVNVRCAGGNGDESFEEIRQTATIAYAKTVSDLREQGFTIAGEE